MRLSRAIFFPLLLAFALLFTQQVGAAHTLRHALEKQAQHDKKTPNSTACEQCEAYAQLSSALNVGTHDFTPLLVSDEAVQHHTISVRSAYILAAAARGPPALLQRNA